MKDIYKYFRIEARELLDALSQGIVDLEKGDSSQEHVGRLLRLAHTLKGAARVVGQREISELTHAMEDILASYREGRSAVTHEHVNRLFYLVDACNERLRLLQTPHAPLAVPSEGGDAGGVVSSRRRTPEEPFTSVRIEIADMDALLHDLAEAGVHLGAVRREITRLDKVIQSCRELERAVVPSNGTALGGSRSGDARSLAEETRIELGRVRRSLQEDFDHAERDLQRGCERASDFRLLPASAIFPTLERSARDAAESLQKRIAFETSGGENYLDAHVLTALRDALIHAVRNAVAHGIEPETERIARGKPPAGRITLRVQRRGQRVSFLCEDDGRGIDVAAIRRAAIQRGLVTPAQAEGLGVAEAIRLLFRGGISTSLAVSEVSGRGVGLEVVQTTAAQQKGEASLRTESLRGTTLEITVPVSIESLVVLEVTAGGTTALIPFDAVCQTMRVRGQELAYAPFGGRNGARSVPATIAAITFEGEAIPFRPLAHILGGRSLPDLRSRSWSAVVMRSGLRAAVGVERLEGMRVVVVRPLPPPCGSIPLLSGATLDEAGNPLLVLDPARLVEAVCSGPGQSMEPASVLRPTILVVDDSLTTRMLEQSILQAAGYEVDLATCGEEALQKARQKSYAAFVVDVEMPGMDGFELLERFRSDPALHHVPAILVTSRSSADDRRRGKEAGARAYIVKSEFDEGRLLHTIRGLIEEKAT